MDSGVLLLVVAGFVLATALVIVLARGSTARWERQRAVERRRRMVRSMRRRRASVRADVPAAQRSTPMPRRGPHVPHLHRRARGRPARRREPG